MRQPRKVAKRPPNLNLALQGGGSHGAFTWGVLDCLLERADFQIDGISGTSAGAVNAVAVAAGFLDGGAKGARQRLDDVWRAINKSHCYVPGSRRRYDDAAAPITDSTLMHAYVRALTQVFSPYEFNPMEIDPLRNILRDHIDFPALQKHSPINLFINATEAQSGRGRIFSGDEVTLDVVLASACLPTLRHAVKIDDQSYWDGGFSSNPPIMPLIENCRAADTLIVRLTPERGADLPVRVNDIQSTVNHIMFSQPLRQEIAMIEMARNVLADGETVVDSLGHRIKGHRFHLLDGAEFTGALGQESSLVPEWDILAFLNRSGRQVTKDWMKANKAAVGRQSTVDLAATFL